MLNNSKAVQCLSLLHIFRLAVVESLKFTAVTAVGAGTASGQKSSVVGNNMVNNAGPPGSVTWQSVPPGGSSDMQAAASGNGPLSGNTEKNRCELRYFAGQNGECRSHPDSEWNQQSVITTNALYTYILHFKEAEVNGSVIAVGDITSVISNSSVKNINGTTVMNNRQESNVLATGQGQSTSTSTAMLRRRRAISVLWHLLGKEEDDEISSSNFEGQVPFALI